MVTDRDRRVAHDLREVVVLLYRRMHKQISNEEQMSVAEQTVMYHLTQQEEWSPSEIGRVLAISSQYLSQVLNHLEKLGFITRNPSLTDKRKSLISLTEKGKRKVIDSRNEREAWLANLIAEQYSATDKETIEKALGLLATLTNR